MTIYLDNSATTAVDEKVARAIEPYLSDKFGKFGNPSSLHQLGRVAKEAIDKARRQVARLLHCQEEEVYFSPCGTISNNVAILGRARFAESNDMGRHMVTTLIEHPSVLGPAKHLQSLGWQVTYLEVDREGFVNVQALKKALTKDTSIISVMWANNEVGTLEPIEEIAAIACERGIFMHTDAVQAAGKIDLDMEKTPLSALALSGHKFHAPKGIGVLYLRKGQNVMPITYGGGQEMALMPGTEGVSNIVAIGAAAEIAAGSLNETQKTMRSCRKVIVDRLAPVAGVTFTGAADGDRRLPGHVSISVEGLTGEAMVVRLDLKGLCVSSGSACHQGIIEPSHVLTAMGYAREQALGSLRISAGRLTSVEECENAAGLIADVIASMRKTAVKA